MAKSIPFHPNQCPACQYYVSNIRRCQGYAVDGPLGSSLLAQFAGESSETCDKFAACPDDAALRRFADAIRASNTHYIKLAETGVAENVVEKKVIYYLAALERRPTGSYSKGIVKGLDYAAQHGFDVGRMKDMYGFSSVQYPPPDEPQTTGSGQVNPPLLSGDDARAAEQWYEKGYKAIYSGFQTEYDCYVKALQHNPNLAKAWHNLRQASSAAGRYDLAERCDDAETILASGRFIDNCRTLLERPKRAGIGNTRKWWQFWH
jgi:TPR repeat protein